MKLTKLSQAIFFGLATFALTACGSSDNDIAFDATATPSPIPVVTPVVTTPTVAPTGADDSTKLARILENAKIAGLTDANATAFAEKAKDFDFGSAEYNEALIKARQDQTDAINAELAKQAEVISPIVDDRNPFIGSVNVQNIATVSANHYVRQPGSTYDLSANPIAIAGLGDVATDDPTDSNPWLSNYVLGTEVVRDANGKPLVVAIDSAGEMVKALNDGTDGARKLGMFRGNGSGYSNNLGTAQARLPASGNRKDSSYYTDYNGLRYTTQSTDGDRFYNYDQASINDPQQGANNRVLTLQEQYSNHGTTPRTSLIENALKAAKGQNYIRYYPNPLNPLLNNGFSTQQEAESGVGSGSVAGGYGDYTRAGLIVYNDASKPVGSAKGQELGYKVPIWGREENVYQVDDVTGKLEVINGVDPLTLSPTTINTNQSARTWYNSRYGSFEIIDQGPIASDHISLVAGGDRLSSDPAPFNGVKVANNDSARIFGKNMLSYEAGATGRQSTDNTYVGKYNKDGTMLTNGIQPAKLHHVQYGRLTNNIDVVADSEIDKRGNDGNPRVLYRGFQPHGAPNSVDTYFYRGTNHTTLDQMKALRGGVVQYHGHALTYNLGPYAVANAKEQAPTGIPTAFGNTTPQEMGNTIGNFVEVRFDIAKGSVEGSIYNFLNKERSDKDEDFKKQDLATFQGKVYGNTVVGTAEKVGVEGQGSLTASFFGSNASEIGGNISSISRGEGYGDAKWGAVFGATRGGSGNSIEQFNVIESSGIDR